MESSSSDHPIQDTAEKIVGKEIEQRASLPVALFLAAGLFVVAGFLAVYLVMARRKIVNLSRKIRQLKVEQMKIAESAALQVNEDVRAANNLEVTAIENHIAALAAKMEKTKEAHSFTLAALESATGWDDLQIIDGRDDDPLHSGSVSSNGPH